MTDRPTPEQIAEDGASGTTGPPIRAFLAKLAEHGYVVVDPDDYPPRPVSIQSLYQAARDHNRIIEAIFNQPQQKGSQP